MPAQTLTLQGLNLICYAFSYPVGLTLEDRETRGRTSDPTVNLGRGGLQGL